MAADQAAHSGGEKQDKPVVIKAKRLYTARGESIDGGMLIVREGRVSQVGANLAIPEGAEVIEIPDAVITPGLIDAHCWIDSETEERPAAARQRRRRPTMWEQMADAHEHARQLADGNKYPALPVAPLALPNTPAVAEDENAISRPPNPRVAESGSPNASAGPVSRLASGMAALDPGTGQPNCPHIGMHELCEGICPHCGQPAGHDVGAESDLAVGPSPRVSLTEHASEITPHLRAIDSVNLLSNDFDRLLRTGVTTVWISPDSGSVIGMRGAVVKTGGPIAKRIVRDADAVKASLGGDPIRRGAFNQRPMPMGVSFMTRRPTTRMGVAWVFRKAFYDAIAVGRGLEPRGADMPPREAVPWLLKLLKGEVGLRVQARKQHDILNALRLAAEFGLGVKAPSDGPVAEWKASLEPRTAAAGTNGSGGSNGASNASTSGSPNHLLIIEEAIEAYRCLPELKAAGVPVIYGPIFDEPEGWRAMTGEANEPRLNTPRQLKDAGIPFALTANDMRDEAGLIRQAMCAVRFGLPAADALRAITAVPAELLGLNGLGVLSEGAGADLVVWSGEPLEATSRAVLVMIDGKVVFKE